tara:strand:- start:2020 stop:3513 length:1494 start_codon:yes stop_codon:yes gene_type:complete
VAAIPGQTQSTEDLIREIQVRRKLKHVIATNKLADFVSYEWQETFYAAGKRNKQRLLMAANRVGKTFSEAREFAFHATGLYPDWWDGIRFKHAPRMWALGVSSEQIRDVIQKELLGDILDGPDWGKGAIPLKTMDMDSIIRSPSARGLVKEIKVYHAPSKSYSSISFKAYEQGQHVLMGQSIDFIWIDEEPRDAAIYPQCVTRTATGNQGRGGYVVMTFTPENGRTPLVSSFLDDIKPGQYIQNVTWDDAPHLDEDTKEQLLGAIPEYQRAMRSKGIPILGSGVIFPVADEIIKVEPFECPDHWFVLDGMDFGWDHPQAHVQLWFDMDEGVTYVVHAWRKSERDASQAWTAVKKWAKDVPSAWPHDGLQHEKGGGEVLKAQYKEAGFDMIETHATHVEGGISVESGLWNMLQDMRDGKFRVFGTCSEFFEEKLLYHRDDNGRVVKVKDDVLSAVRYAYMMKRYAIPMGSIKKIRQNNGIGNAPAVHDWDPYGGTGDD